MQKLLHFLLKTFPLKFRLLLTILYLFLITWLSLTAPQNLPDLSFFNLDKLAHMGAYFGLVVLLYWSAGTNSKGQLPYYPVLIAIAWGLLMELGQYLLTNNRSFSWLDSFANTMGCFMAAWVWNLVLGFLGRGER